MKRRMLATPSEIVHGDDHESVLPPKSRTVIPGTTAAERKIVPVKSIRVNFDFELGGSSLRGWKGIRNLNRASSAEIAISTACPVNCLKHQR